MLYNFRKEGDAMATTEQIIDALWRAARGVQAYRDLPEGLRRAHLYVLHAIDELGGTARVSDIAAKTLVAMPNMTKLLKETDAAGWTTRSSIPTDKRTLMVSITPTGSKCLNRYYREYIESIGQRLDPESNPHYDVMIQAIDQALAAIEQANAATRE
jgi:DNA-binding MarR family transcriptional regulator